MRTGRTFFTGAWLVLVIGAAYAAGGHIRRVTHAGAVPQRIASLTGMGSATNHAAIEQDGGGNPEDIFRDVVRYVHSEYVDKGDDNVKLSQGAIRRMVASLDDPKTRFYDATQVKQLEAQLDGRYTGIGATLTVTKQKVDGVESRRLTVVAPVPGGPAQKAGLQGGDLITEINGQWVIAYDPRVQVIENDKGMEREQLKAAFKDAVKRLQDGLPLPKALEALGSNKTKDIKLTVERKGAATPLKLDVQTMDTAMAPVEWRALNDKVAYLRVSAFNGRATDEIRKALAAQPQHALILDLRDNVGGPASEGRLSVMSSALSLVGRLSKGGNVATLVRRNKKEEPILAPANTVPGIKRIAVLVNGGTSNIAELVAATLKEKAGATLVGSKTFGDGAYQKLVHLSDGSAITVNAGKLVTANGVDLSTAGLVPDHPVAASAAGTDTVLAKASELLATGN